MSDICPSCGACFARNDSFANQALISRFILESRILTHLMQKIKGSVGPEVLRSLTPTPFANHKIVRAFRDYVEDRIENHYGVMATIAITDEGSMEFELVAKDTVVTDKELELFTRKCLKEFKENPVNEAYNT